MNTPTHSRIERLDPLVCGLLSGCPNAVVDAISQGAQLRSYRPGAVIFSEGEPVDGVYCHCTGDVSIQLGHGPSKHEVGRSHPGMILGYREPERYGRYIVSAVAHSDATLCFIPLDLFTAQLQSSPHLMLNVMRSLSQRIDGLEERMVA